jgi:hypothetical protein
VSNEVGVARSPTDRQRFLGTLEPLVEVAGRSSLKSSRDFEIAVGIALRLILEELLAPS